MFRGRFNINLDVKGRVAIPARLRAPLLERCQGDMVVTIHTEEPCLLIYPLPDWEDIQKDVEQLSSLNVKTARVKRLLIGHATDIRIDGSSRLQLTPPLRDYAGLEKKGVLLGQGKGLELWDEASWVSREAVWKASSSGMDDIPPELQNLSL